MMAEWLFASSRIVNEIEKRSVKLAAIFSYRKQHESEADSRAYEAVKGSLSTKIEAVVQTLIRIQVS